MVQERRLWEAERSLSDAGQRAKPEKMFPDRPLPDTCKVEMLGRWVKRQEGSSPCICVRVLVPVNLKALLLPSIVATRTRQASPPLRPSNTSVCSLDARQSEEGMEPCRQLLAAAKVCNVLALTEKKAEGSTPWKELLLMSTRVTLPVCGRKSRLLLVRRFAARDSE
jgi:hypothetical protein